MASGVERISALPEELLLHVLHSLPSQDAVRTCVLARRWRGVWRSVPALRFRVANGWGNTHRFAQFVDHLLHLRCGGAGAPVDFCDFDFEAVGVRDLPASEQHAGRWVCEAVSQVRALRIRVVNLGQIPSPLSDMRLVSQHLTRLEFIGVGVNDDRVADFSACPALVQLNMDDCDLFVKQILSPSLKHLRIAGCYLYEHNRILISLPNLVSLELIEFQQGRIPLLGSLPSLARAVVILDEKCSDYCSQDRFDDCGGVENETCEGCYYYYGEPGYPEYGPHCDRNDSIFLKGLSEATDLQLSADSDVIVFNRDLKWCPTFTKLKTLLLNDWCLAAHHNALIFFSNIHQSWRSLLFSFLRRLHM